MGSRSGLPSSVTISFHVNPGSLFPSLYRLEQDGKLKAEWQATENNRRASPTDSRPLAGASSSSIANDGIAVSFAVRSVLEGA